MKTNRWMTLAVVLVGLIILYGSQSIRAQERGPGRPKKEGIRTLSKRNAPLRSAIEFLDPRTVEYTYCSA